MKTYITLLRGINIGGKNILPMKALTVLLEKNGLDNIKTYIQSGNIVFTSKTTANANVDETISELIETQFGFKPQVMVLEKSAFDVAIKNNPYTATEGKTIHFYFCKTKPNIHAEKLAQYQSESEQVHLDHNVFYLYAPDGIGRSKLVANIEACLGVSATGRNLNTVNKLKQKVEDT